VATYALRSDVLAPGTPAPAGVVLISGTDGTDTTSANDGRLAYFGEDLSGWPRASTLGNVLRANLPVLMSVSEFDNPGTVRSMVELANELTVEHGRMPRFVQLVGHNHYSPNPSIGTQDTQLSAEILRFVRTTAASRLQMSAR
jgi:acetyl esterase